MFSKNIVTKKITLSYLEHFYSERIVKNVKEYLINIRIEKSRDRLTEFGLI